MIRIDDDDNIANMMEGSSPIAMCVSNRPIESDNIDYLPPTIPDIGPFDYSGYRRPTIPNNGPSILVMSLIRLDQTFFKGIYKGILLAVVGVDANENIFSITYVVVESENAASCTWFLELLNEQFSERPDLPALTILSDHQKRLQIAIEIVFPITEQGYCMNILADNFKKVYRNSALTKLYWKAALALTISDFDEYMAKIKSANAEAYNWIMLQHPKYWANTYFQRCRYNHLTSNISESFNQWILQARDITGSREAPNRTL
ncbi:hypothetical protein AMTR_s00059p00205030 [Amborella trichopoda]|uniref:MULE transposase domain-containing protein n=1 Tax=Amborella trichopoda TaxID=13333 RepID=U5D8E1_AMBTC|nr:hypothetical protein AMTR_s00059p00205030 [Amborella trichopoda]